MRPSVSGPARAVSHAPGLTSHGAVWRAMVAAFHFYPQVLRNQDAAEPLILCLAGQAKHPFASGLGFLWGFNVCQQREKFLVDLSFYRALDFPVTLYE